MSDRFGRHELRIADGFTISADNSYAIGDVVGGLIEMDVSGGVGGGGIITDLYLLDKANQKEEYTIHIFQAEPETIVDNAAFAEGLAPADMTAFKKIAAVSLVAAHYEEVVVSGPVTYAQAHVDGLNITYKTTNGKLYYYLECVATPDHSGGSTSDLSLASMLWLN